MFPELKAVKYYLYSRPPLTVNFRPCSYFVFLMLFSLINYHHSFTVFWQWGSLVMATLHIIQSCADLLLLHIFLFPKFIYHLITLPSSSYNLMERLSHYHHIIYGLIPQLSNASKNKHFYVILIILKHIHISNVWIFLFPTSSVLMFQLCRTHRSK